MKTLVLLQRSNFSINDNVLENSLRFGVEKVVSSLSTCIFPDQINYPFDESMVSYLCNQFMVI